MKKIVNDIYIRSPFFIKRILANIEAIRRDRYRKYGDYKNIKESIDFSKYMVGYSEKEREHVIKEINNLLTDAKNNVPFYNDKKIETITNLNDLSKVPILTKNDIRKNKKYLVSNRITSKNLWEGSSSGSTGTPLKYYRDNESVRINQALYDSYYESLGCDLSKKRIRFSGIKLASFNKKRPPFWVYIDKYKQLQCSVYHLSDKNCKYYIDKIHQFRPEFGTGYPSAWGCLAEYINKNDIKMPEMKAIITDSEAMSGELQDKIEKAFKCTVYHTYGLSEVGMVAMQCENRHYHLVPKLNFVEIVNSDDEKVANGNEGEIIITDLNSNNFPIIRYKTGDRGILENKKECACGCKTPYLTEITGRIEDYILTTDGRKIHRVSQLLKPAIGIKESQIIQKSKNEILIKVIPDINFEEESMKEVILNAEIFIGNMNVKWEAVDDLERMPSGKMKFLIKEFNE